MNVYVEKLWYVFLGRPLIQQLRPFIIIFVWDILPAP